MGLKFKEVDGLAQEYLKETENFAVTGPDSSSARQAAQLSVQAVALLAVAESVEPGKFTAVLNAAKLAFKNAATRAGSGYADEAGEFLNNLDQHIAANQEPKR